MPKSVKELLADSLSSISLNILVFGPQVTTPSTDPRTQKLQAKRQDIKAHLAAEGHTAKFAEELVDPALPATAFIQELVIMEEYDLIVVLVETPGSIVEMAVIARTPTLARKSARRWLRTKRSSLARTGSLCERSTSVWPVDGQSWKLSSRASTTI